MPAISSISVNDAETTPVAHVFSPVTTDGELGQWANRISGMPAGFEKMSISVKPPGSATAAYRWEAKLAHPVAASVDGIQTVVRTSNSTITLNFSQSGTIQERKNQLKELANLLIDPTVVASVSNLEPFY